MDFRLTKEQEMMQKLCREFAVNEIEPLAAEIDAEERYPWETVRKLQKYGLLGIQFPKELGGSGGDNICYTIAIEEASSSAARPAVSCRPTQPFAAGRSSSTAPRSRRKSGSAR